MSSDGDYDWNVRARLIEVLHKGRQSAEDAEHSFTWPEDEIPVNDEELPESLVSQHKLNHGDILRYMAGLLYRHCILYSATPTI